MPYVEVFVDGSEVLNDLDEEALREELDRRARKKAPVGGHEISDKQLLEQTYWHFRDNAGAPECLREYIYRLLGKTF
jgi:hypothetical protein